uniref:Uncharacterized protein n=1 Tax=Saimiri boliviensis boliviensis TaxID=39432 RepID=A0A2K6SGL5_SAIBB
MKYFETEVSHCVFDDLSVLEIYSWKMHLNNSKFSCITVRCSIHSRDNYLLLLMILRASLIFQPLWVSCALAWG